MLRAKYAAVVFLLLAFTISDRPVEAADDPSIKGELRASIQTAMGELIQRNTVDGVFRHYDPVAGKLLRLQLKELHDGIVQKGDFYVSCADFKDEAGNTFDLDFLVVPAGDGVRAVQALVHKSDGVKRPYHLESD